MNVMLRAWLGFAGLAVVMAAFVFGCAGTIRYAAGWIYLAIFFTASLLITLYLMKHDPALLERRVDSGPWAETRSIERVIMSLAAFGFIATIGVPGFDHRFHWSSVALPVIVAGDVLTAVAFAVIFVVYKENTFTSATIAVAPEQRVIDTGPYALVRHPMYAGALVLFIGTPLALGSFWGLAPLVLCIPILLWRLFDEESVLTQSLHGYAAYCRRVRWRLIPGLF